MRWGEKDGAGGVVEEGNYSGGSWKGNDLVLHTIFLAGDAAVLWA